MLEAVRRAPQSELSGRRHRRPICSSAASDEVRGRRRLGVRRPADRRPGHHRRLQDDRRGPRQPGAAGSCSASASRSSPAATDTAGLTKACSTAPAPTRRGSISTSTARNAESLGVSVSDVFNTLQVYFGSYYVNNFNEFGRTWQVNVQADREVPRPGRRHSPTASAQQSGADDPARRRCWMCATRSGPVMVMRYNLLFGGGYHRRCRAGHQFRRRPST